MVALKKFPRLKIAYSSTKEQSWDTQIQTAGSGRIRTLTNRLYPKWTITCKISHMTNEEQKLLMGFVALHRGAHIPFLFYDHEHHYEAKVQLTMVNSGVYQFVMKMGEFAQPVAHVENVTVFVDGVKQEPSTYSVSNGRLRFNKAPARSAIVKSTYDYWWKVMLSSDSVSAEQITNNSSKSKNIKLVSVE